MRQNKPKILFFHAKNPSNHSDIYFNNYFNNMPLKGKNTQKHLAQSAITYSKLTIETLEKGVKYVQS